MINVVFTASPAFTCFTVLALYADFYLSHLRATTPDIRLMPGGDPEVDALVERYARSRGLEWRRPEAAADGLPEEATHLIAFWDGRSEQPARLIAEARRRGLLYRVARL